MTDFHKVFSIYHENLTQTQSQQTFSEIKRANASINQDYSKDFVRITIKIPQMKTSFNLRKLRREPKNGLPTETQYHRNRITFEFILNHGKSNELKYQYSNREVFRGPIEYKKSYLKYRDEYVSWFIHKTESW
ncbi:unnamed protein product [Didymodactylos carnosus]|uniref:Uncharacterized protein n=1 Tax=Didymodactylos carnosus TaxID=1234261 RepID=A0A813QQE7_9BILA|nr:unnamed protein product [Didymodactylos carnosus]CAF1271049.1 unnamed protein product [Didymodactylos carnosus]CAF3552587.1 unnamed protein product [Didymodactylos carnosus]CAF4076572.1 unnamed protein product [Didymodactylos carnosus]